jgi:predicted alpha/beta superfamily hydrolase
MTGRILDLTPQDPYQNEVIFPDEMITDLTPRQLRGNDYLRQITDLIAPAICQELGVDLGDINKAVIGSSMGGLAFLYALGKRPDFFSRRYDRSGHNERSWAKYLDQPMEFWLNSRINS